MTGDGVVDRASFEAQVRDDTAIARVMWVNNEIGTIQPIAELAASWRKRARCALPHRRRAGVRQGGDRRARGPVRHPVHLRTQDRRAQGHRRAVHPARHAASSRCFHGGSQDRGRRPGTENVAFAVGSRHARPNWRSPSSEVESRASAQRCATGSRRCSRSAFPTPWSTARRAPRAPHILNVSVPGTDSESLLMALDLQGIACSAGSACQSGSSSPSHVLAAIGVEPRLAAAAIRMSLGVLTTEADIERVAEVFPRARRQGARRGRGLTMASRDVSERVLVAMSGGVDSSVAAAMLVEQGYDVVGATMKLFCYGDEIVRPPVLLARFDRTTRAASASRSACRTTCSTSRVRSARDVVDDFVSEYARGRTPIPCVRCNTFTKFRDLVHKADAHRRALDRHRPLRARRGRRAAPRRRPRQGPVVLPLGHRPRGARTHAPAGRRRRPRPRRAPWRAGSASRSWPTSSRARTSASCPTATTRRSSAQRLGAGRTRAVARSIRALEWRGRGRARRLRTLHHRPAPRTARRIRRADVRGRHPAGRPRGGDRPARGATRPRRRRARA